MSAIEVKAKLKYEKCENRQQSNVSKSDLVFLIDNHSRNDAIKMDNLKKRRKRLVIFLIIVVLSLFSIVLFGRSLNSEEVCALSLSLTRKKLFNNDNHISNNNINNHNNSSSLNGKSTSSHLHLLLSYDDVLNDDIQNKFDINSNDVMVFLHIQKTGGTSFGKHLVRDLDLKRKCTCQRKKKRCYCFRPNRNENWLFSRYSTGWKCGLHADWTELISCVDQEFDKNEGETTKRRYFYITLLRSPIARYLSEYRHVQRGATWKNSRHFCLGRQATSEELPPCYTGDDWMDVTLDEFADCESNLAANRQTRMLADLALVNCYNKTGMSSEERDRIMLASAKRNLAAMSFFGLTEYQKISQYIFEETFNLRFAIPFEQHNSTLSMQAFESLTEAQQTKIKKINALDIELYDFAKELMFQRFKRLKAKDSDFNFHFSNLGNIRDKGSEFNWDTVMDNVN
ncbi:hypothetical protein PVAND_003820 [Polypedilum vanderplanki]|uniref:Heparan-sulfate 6-O-sulfotransferase n=1 Tax=Polypedilum vanderplanki TaxID=319348 RepID=A0A9J6BW92_POLVA|nr:hypothetical protein PVAND_003820 [Polypedilum vanderplanki]